MVAIYTRQSVERADSISVEQQAQLCRDALPTREAQSCRVYTDKGFSGKNIDRPALQQLLADADAGLVDKILVYRLDRISRSVHDFTGLCARLSAQGVHFQSVTEGVTLDNSPSGTVMAQIMMVFAQFERETIQRRVTDNYFARAKTGMYLGGRPPFGFAKGQTTVGGRRTACYVPHPTQAAQAAALFARYLQDSETLGSLVRRLNADGLPAARGGSWSTLPLGRLLRNPAFVRADAAVYRYLQSRGAAMNDPVEAYDQRRGCYCYAPLSTAPPGQRPTRRKFSDLTGSFITLAPHEGLVDADCWLAVQHKLDAGRALKRSGAGTHSWLSGLMRCRKCGYAITVVGKPAGMGGHYINCGGRKRGAAVCPGRSKTVTLEQIEGAAEAALLRHLRQLRAAPLQLPQRRDAQANRLEMAIARHEADIAQLTQNLAHIREPDVIRIVAAQIQQASDARAACIAQRDARLRRDGPDTLEALFDAVPDEWPGYTLPEKKAVARAAIARVLVDEDSVEVVFRAQAGVR